MPTLGNVSRISTERESHFGENKTSLSVYAMISPGAPANIVFYAAKEEKVKTAIYGAAASVQVERSRTPKNSE